MNLVEQMQAPPVAAAFDYGRMDQAAASEAKAVAGRYRTRQKAYVMDTGRDLLAVKERLDHGLFLAWVEAEMGLTARTAQNFMQAASQLGAKGEIVSHLPPTTLYKLSAASTPEPVRREILSRLEASERLTADDIAARIDQAKADAAETARIEREAARRAALTPEQREEEDALQGRGVRRREAAERKAERAAEERSAEDRQRDAKAAPIAHWLIGRLGAEDAAALMASLDDYEVRQRALTQARDLADVSRASGAEPENVNVGDIERTLRASELHRLCSEERREIETIAEAYRRGEAVEPIVVRRGQRGRLTLAHGAMHFRAVADVLRLPTIAARVIEPARPLRLDSLG